MTDSDCGFRSHSEIDSRWVTEIEMHCSMDSAMQMATGSARASYSEIHSHSD